jgi:hypothetical protein
MSRNARIESDVLCESNAQAFILAEDPSEGWKNQNCTFCTLCHFKRVKDGLKVELFDRSRKSKGSYKWNPSGLKSKEDTRYLVLMVKPWDQSRKKDDKYITMMLKFLTEAGAEMWTSLSKQMVDKIQGLTSPHSSSKELGASAYETKELEKESLEASQDLQVGKYTIVSSKVDWVSFWSSLDENTAHRTLLPVSSVVEVSNVKGRMDSRGMLRTQCRVIYLYHPHFSELADDEVPKTGARGWIKGNYLARRSPTMSVFSNEQYSEAEVLAKYEDEVLMMNDAIKSIREKITMSTRTLLLRALRVTLQHVVINPFRARKLRRYNPKHSNIFLHEAGPELLATVGFEVGGNEELNLPSVAAKIDMAKLILLRITQITREDTEAQHAAIPNPKPPDARIVDSVLVKLNVGGTIFQTMQSNLKPCKKLNLKNHLRLSSGEYFIDRDPEMFRHILKYLRGNQVLVGNKTFLSDLLKESKHYGITSLTRVLEKKVDGKK